MSDQVPDDDASKLLESIARRTADPKTICAPVILEVFEQLLDSMDTNTVPSPWEKAKDKFLAFAAELLPPGTKHFKLPDSGEVVSLQDFQAHRDRDNDFTHWTLERKGVKYIVLND